MEKVKFQMKWQLLVFSFAKHFKYSATLSIRSRTERNRGRKKCEIKPLVIKYDFVSNELQKGNKNRMAKKNTKSGNLRALETK